MEQLDMRKVADKIKDYVDQYYEKHNKPILLSELGSRHAELLREVKTSDNPLGLAQIIQSYLGSDMVMISDVHHPAHRFVGPFTQRDDVEKFAKDNPPALKSFRGTSLDAQAMRSDTQSLDDISESDIKRSVLYAFTQPLKHGQSRYLIMDYPFRFTDVDEEGEQPQNATLIEQTYVQRDRGAFSRHSLSEAFKNFKEWVKVKRINWRQLLYLPDHSGEISNKSHKNDLVRLIEAQPETLRGKMLIPADIAIKLMGR